MQRTANGIVERINVGVGELISVSQAVKAGDRVFAGRKIRTDSQTPKQVRQVAAWECKGLSSLALDWQWRYNNNPQEANPFVTISTGLDGQPFRSADGYRQEIMLGMFDENGERGKGWLTEVRGTFPDVSMSLWLSHHCRPSYCPSHTGNRQKFGCGAILVSRRSR